MKSRIKKKYIIISLIAAFLGISAAIILHRYLGIDPFKKYVLSDICDFDADDGGNKYVLNNAGMELLEISGNELTGIIKGHGVFNNNFSRGVQVCHDSDGNIYVLNKVSDETAGSSYKEERVVRFTKNGKYDGDVMCIVHDRSVFCPSIAELQNIYGKVCAIVILEDNIYIRDVLSGEDIAGPFYISDGNRMVKNAEFDADNGMLYVVLKTGAVLRFDEDSCEVVYEIEKDDEKTVLSDISVTDDGRIIVSDIGIKTIFEIMPEGERRTVAQFDTVPYNVFCTEDSSSVFIGSSYNILEYDDGLTDECGELSYSAGFRLMIFCVWLSIILTVISVLYLLRAAVITLNKKITAKTRVMVMISVFGVVLTALFCLLVQQSMNRTLRDDAIEKMQDDAALINQIIDKDAFKRIRTCADYTSEEYESVKKTCEQVILTRGTDANNYYAIIYTLNENDEISVRYSTEEEYGCNYPYIWSDGTDERRVYDTGEPMAFPEPSNDPTGSFVDVYNPLSDASGEVVGIIEVGCDYDVLMDEVNDVILQVSVSILALMIVFLLVVIEGIEYFHERRNAKAVPEKKERVPSLKMYRLVVFLVFFVTNLTTPFLSLYSLELSEKYEGLLGMSTEVLSAIPISAEVLFGAVFSILGNRIILKLNRRKSAFIGFALFFTGLVIRFLYPDFFVLTLGNGMQGAGWGILLLIVNSTIAAEEDPGKQEDGFTGYNMALQNGMNSGVVAGGFLLLFFGYRSVLIIAAAMSVIMFPFIRNFVFDKDIKNGKQKAGKSVTLADTVRFIFKPRILLYFTGIVIPVIGASYYLFYLYPIIGNSFGISETMVGYSYLIMGLITICFSNIIVKFVTKLFSKKAALVAASLIYLIAFAIVGIFYNIAALIIALVLLPISDSFGYVIQETYYSELKETKELGYEKAMGVYSLFENLAQTAGTMVFGYILTVGVSSGLIVFGIVIASASLIFCIFSKNGKKEKKLAKTD